MEITITKLDHTGSEVWRYIGKLLKRDTHSITIEATFDRPDIEFHGLTLCTGDRFIETYYDNHWYNIYEIFDKNDDHFKGWYCNIGFPADIQSNAISYKDLALDLLVFPDGHHLVLDEDEFNLLDITEEEQRKALEALSDLKCRFRMK